jgi:GNAT superfamily N-acetyltransferase
VLTVRLADQNDVDVLRRIAVAAYGHYITRIGRPPAPMTADYAQPVRDGQAWVAEEDGQVAGFVVLVPQPGHLLLEKVAVLPAAQGRGIGARLLTLAEDQARRPGLPEVRPPARARSVSPRSTCSSAADSSGPGWLPFPVTLPIWCLLRPWSYTVEITVLIRTRGTTAVLVL